MIDTNLYVGLVLIQRRNSGPALRRQWVDVPCLLCALFAVWPRSAGPLFGATLDSTTVAQRWPNFWSESRVFLLLFFLQSDNGILLGGAFA